MMYRFPNLWELADLTNTKIRNVLAAFLFTGDDVFKKIEDLSGGERPFLKTSA